MSKACYLCNSEVSEEDVRKFFEQEDTFLKMIEGHVDAMEAYIEPDLVHMGGSDRNWVEDRYILCLACFERLSSKARKAFFGESELSIKALPKNGYYPLRVEYSFPVSDADSRVQYIRSRDRIQNPYPQESIDRAVDKLLGA